MPERNRLEDILDRYIVGENGCWVWQSGCNPGGYGMMRFRGMMQFAHRLSWLHHNGPIPDNLFVLHKCDNKPCINPEHLWLGTHTDNAQDRVSKGRSASCIGSDNSKAILNENTVRIIRIELSEGKTCAELARKYRVTWPTINYIKINKTWRHVE